MMDRQRGWVPHTVCFCASSVFEPLISGFTKSIDNRCGAPWDSGPRSLAVLFAVCPRHSQAPYCQICLLAKMYL